MGGRLKIEFVVAWVMLACGGSTDETPTEHAPQGWHPVGTPIELGTEIAEIQIANDSRESLWSVHAGAWTVLQKSKCWELVRSNCRVRACRSPADPDSPSIEPRQIGHLTVDVGAQTVVIPAGGAGPNGPMPLWEGSTQIQVISEGANVPAFNIVLNGPDRVETTLPQFPPFGGYLELAWDDPVGLAWENGRAGQVVHGVLGWETWQDKLRYSTTIDCEFDAASGGGEIPAEAMREVPRESALASTILVVFTQETVTTQAGDYLVTATATNPARSTQGEISAAWLTPK